MKQRDATIRLRFGFAACALAALTACAGDLFAAAAGKHPARISFAVAGMDPAMSGRIEKAVAAALEKGEMAGCVVLIGRRDGIVYEHAFDAPA